MEERTITIEKIVFGGKGLARDNGQVIFVPFVLPGERVRVHVTKVHRDYLEAEPVEIIEPSRSRIPPACPYFGRCGGCQLSHTDYETQFQIKLGMLEETLNRSHLKYPAIQSVSSKSFEYRHRARLQYSPKRQVLGFFETESNRIVDVQECLCLTPGLNQLLRTLRGALTAAPVAGLSEIELFENDLGETSVYFNAKIPDSIRNGLPTSVHLFGPDDPVKTALALRFKDFQFPMHPQIFLQVNPGLWKAMIQEVESHFANASTRIVAELYCGAGFFTLPLSKLAQKVYACEENEKAIKYAAEFYRSSNVSWICRKAEDYKIPGDVSAVVLDPPRSGLHRKVTLQLAERKFDQITYVSCDPTSLARDLKALDGQYQINRISMLDLFPQTYHFETIVLLSKRAP